MDLATWLVTSGVIVPPGQYLARLDSIERMAEHETEPELYHGEGGGGDGSPRPDQH